MPTIPRERWQQIDQLFAEALERPADERTAFLRATCGDDVELYSEVVALLKSDAEAEDALGESVSAFAAPLLPDLDTEWEDDLAVGDAVGPYRVVEELGRGGMGAVYLAERADGLFVRQVALKVVKRGMDTDEILRRFRHERQILASLNHPNIARLYDGGMTADGRPYLAMEYIDGQRLDRYCDAHRLSVEERLQLFMTVGEAVQFAHQNLVIHRDLKPSNILVTEKGRVKLLDFGIAKLLAEDVSETAITQTGMRVLTPEYAAPEQVAGTQVTTTADVYALGVVLYELLTGRRPKSNETTGTPDRPSTAVTKTMPDRDGTATIEPEAVGAARGTNASQLQRRLRGDVDVICLKALRPEPERRYASAEAFVEDIRRHLAGLPVTARPDTFGYRFRSFVRRHQLGVALTAAFVALLVGFAAFYTVRVTEERDLAQVERDKAQQAVTFLENLFQASDPFVPQDEPLDSLRIRDFIHLSTAKVRRDLDQQPELQTQMLQTLGVVYFNLGLYAEADSLLRESLTRRRQFFADDHPDLGRSLFELGALQQYMQAFDEAEALLSEALVVQRRAHGDEHPEVARTLNRMAELFRHKNEVARTDSLGQMALAIQRQTLGTHQETARTLDNLGLLYMSENRLDEAEPKLREALAMRREVLGEEHPEVAASINNLAGLMYNRGNLPEATDLLRESLGITQAALGDAHPDVAGILNNLAGLLMRQQRYDEAEPLFQRSLDLHRQLFGATHPRVAHSMNNLGELYRLQGNAEAAEPVLREALAMRQAAFGPEHPLVARTLNNLGLVLMEREQYAEAETVMAASESIRRSIFPPTHPEVVRIVTNRAHLFTVQGRFDEAEAKLLELADVLNAEPEAQAQLPQVYQTLEALYKAWDKPDEAATYEALLQAD